jgi:hypothetical protein
MRKHSIYLSTMLSLFLCTVSQFLLAQPPGAQNQATVKGYRFRSVDYPGSDLSLAVDFNGKVAVGYTDTGSFYFDGTTYTNLTIPGITAPSLSGINKLGVMVGYYYDNGLEQGFTYDGKTFVTIGYPGAATWLQGINDSRQVIGYYELGDTVYSFVYSGGKFTTIAFPGAIQTYLSAINSSGDIVGWYQEPTADHGFLLKDGTYYTIDIPLCSGTVVAGINDSDDMVANFGVSAFIVSQGAYYVLEVLGAKELQLNAIKNNGDVVGYIIDNLDNYHGIIGH